MSRAVSVSTLPKDAEEKEAEISWWCSTKSERCQHTWAYAGRLTKGCWHVIVIVLNEPGINDYKCFRHDRRINDGLLRRSYVRFILV